MRNIFLTFLLLVSFDGIAGAKPEFNGSNSRQEAISLLKDKCGYIIGENISSKIIRPSFVKNEKLISFDFYVLMRPANRRIHGKLSFGCFARDSKTLSSNGLQKTTAADEIALEDSGGRYARNIVWQRKYEGKNWGGTIAYVNSVFGDQERLASPDYFLICPNKIGFPCFSFEVAKERLNKRESDKIPGMLGGIEIIDSRSMAPETSDKQR